MDIIKNIEESKKQTAILNNLVIDFEYLKNLTAQVLNEKAKKDENFFAACSVVKKLCDDISLELKDLKEIIPQE